MALAIENGIVAMLDLVLGVGRDAASGQGFQKPNPAEPPDRPHAARHATAENRPRSAASASATTAADTTNLIGPDSSGADRL